MPEDDEAVSPLIGTILLVAITVITAAVVFVMAGQLGQKSERTPAISFWPEKDEGLLKVLKAPQEPDDIQWSVFEITGSCTPLLNGLAMPPPPGSKVKAGDVLSGCASGEDLSIVHTESSTLVYHYRF